MGTSPSYSAEAQSIARGSLCLISHWDQRNHCGKVSLISTHAYRLPILGRAGTCALGDTQENRPLLRWWNPAALGKEKPQHKRASHSHIRRGTPQLMTHFTCSDICQDTWLRRVYWRCRRPFMRTVCPFPYKGHDAYSLLHQCVKEGNTWYVSSRPQTEKLEFTKCTEANQRQRRHTFTHRLNHGLRQLLVRLMNDHQ